MGQRGEQLMNRGKKVYTISILIALGTGGLSGFRGISKSGLLVAEPVGEESKPWRICQTPAEAGERGQRSVAAASTGC